MLFIQIATITFALQIFTKFSHFLMVTLFNLCNTHAEVSRQIISNFIYSYELFIENCKKKSSQFEEIWYVINKKNKFFKWYFLKFSQHFRNGIYTFLNDNSHSWRVLVYNFFYIFCHTLFVNYHSMKMRKIYFEKRKYNWLKKSA